MDPRAIRELEKSMESELMEYEEHHAHGSHHIRQQLKEGIITRNPKLFETIAYFFFMCAFMWLCLSTQGGRRAFSFTSSIRTHLGDFESVQDHEGWFVFMEKTLPSVVVPSQYYNGQELEDEHLRTVGGEFLLLGAITARQVRVKNLTCSINTDDLIYPSVHNCFGEYSRKNEERQPYGPLQNAAKFKYSTAKDMGCKVGCMIFGWLNSYQGGGYQVVLPSERNVNTTNNFVTKVSELKEDRWLDRQTRAVFVEFTVYSLYSELIAVVQLWYESSAQGGTRSYIQVIFHALCLSVAWYQKQQPDPHERAKRAGRGRCCQ